MSKALENLEAFFAEASDLIAYANKKPKIIDLLYQLDRMPEQVEQGTRKWGEMLIIIAAFREQEEEP